MSAERAGYTVTMFLVDTSPSMDTTRTVEVPTSPNGETVTTDITNLEWALQFVKLKVQEMIYNGRKTDQCGVIVFGSEDTDNIINEKHGGYERVKEYIPIGTPNAATLAKLDALRPSSVAGDPIDALIVGIETQHHYLTNKKTWTRKIVLVTDGENPIEIEDWEATVKKMDSLKIALTVVGIDFDDEELLYYEENKSTIKRENEKFYATLTSSIHTGIIGTCALALRETTRPDIKQVKSALVGTVLRLGDVEVCPDEAAEIIVKISKCTAVTRAKSWKKFAYRSGSSDEEDIMDIDGEAEKKATFVELKMRSDFYIDRNEEVDNSLESDVNPDSMHIDEDGEAEDKDKDPNLEKVEKEELVKGFKYGTTYVPCPDGQFPRLTTRKGIDICGFFSAKKFPRHLSMGEITYIWADPTQPQQQVALSSIIQAMYEKNVMAIARWVSKDGMDPRMGVLKPSVHEGVDCLLWAQMPFADDVRKYTFASLDNLVNKKGERITQHAYIPTPEQQDAMDNFVDAMDLMEAGEKDEDGNRTPWFDTRLSYNPSIHRVKQALFHCAVVSDIQSNPLPPAHPELLKYFEPPPKVVKRAKDASEECKNVFKVKEVPKRIAKQHKDGHVHARDDEDEPLLLDRKQLSPSKSQSHPATQVSPIKSPSNGKSKAKRKGKRNESDTETEDDSDSELLLEQNSVPAKALSKPTTPPSGKDKRGHPLPTPARSLSPSVPPSTLHASQFETLDDLSDQIDPGFAPNRIIGSTRPLRDFQVNISQGDVVTKAVEDLGAVINEIVARPFAMRRADEMVECMHALRDTCLKEDEVDAWNHFLRILKKTCTIEPGNLAFWSHVQMIGKDMSFITDKEARRYGGSSAITENEAVEFFS